jgi:hypothetical protein
VDAANAQLQKAQQQKDGLLFDLKKAKEALAAASRPATEAVSHEPIDGLGQGPTTDNLRATVRAQEREIAQLLHHLDALSAARAAKPTSLAERANAYRAQQVRGHKRWPPTRGHPPRPQRLSSDELELLAAEQRQVNMYHNGSTEATEIVGHSTLPSIARRGGR